MERIRLSNHTFEGANNAYLFADGPETVLVDTGDRYPATREQLEGALAEHDTGFGDIDRILLTHWHGDHTGLAGAIQAESDAEVLVHAADAPLVEGDEDAWATLHERQRRFFERWGVPPADQATVEDVVDSVTLRDEPPAVTTIADGDTLEVNGTTLEVVHAPGHAAGLCMFTVGDEVIAGDALLPKYTPNVGGADIRVERPLEQYLDTLAAIVEADYEVAWPGHRTPIDEPTDRAKYIIDHHEERSYLVLDALRRLGPCDAWTVSGDLFGALEGIHILHGPGEAWAHLDHLEREGVVERTEAVKQEEPAESTETDERAGTAEPERWEYQLADGVAGQVEDIETERWDLR